MTANVTAQLIAQCDSIIVDGANYTISDKVSVEGNYVTVKNFNIMHAGAPAIDVSGSHNLIANNSLSYNDVAIDIKGDDNIIVENNISSGVYPYIYVSSNNNIIVKNFMLGIGLGGSNNTIIANTIFIIEPISDVIASNNTFYLNNFQVQDGFGCSGSNAFYYNGTGNYWSDYNGTDANGDGIGDTPYDLRPNNNDSYPLMERTALQI